MEEKEKIERNLDFYTTSKEEWSKLREEFRKTRLSWYIRGIERSACAVTFIAILLTVWIDNEDLGNLVWELELLFGALFEIVIRFMYYVFLRDFAKKNK